MRSGIMTKKKKKKNYIDFEADAGQGFENFDKPPTKINVFDRARKIKSWNMFIHLVEQENITPAEALVTVLKHVKKNWNQFKIIKDPEQREAVAYLLQWEEKLTRKRLYASDQLKDFCTWTGYKIPKSYKTFENEMAAFRAVFDAKRSKTGEYARKQLLRAEEKLRLKLEKIKKLKRSSRT